MKHGRRRPHLAHAGLQGRLILSMVACCLVSLLFQVLLVAHRIALLAVDAPAETNEALFSLLGPLILSTFLPAAGITLLVFLGLGLRLSHRIAGPSVRIHGHLDALIRGEEVGSLSLRKGDELHELAAIVDRLTPGLRRGHAETRATAGEEPAGPARAA